MGVKERILEYIKFKKIPIKKFEERCGLSNGYISAIRRGFGSEKLENVLKEFPDLNRNWLLFGEGSMLTTSTDQLEIEEQIAGSNVFDLKQFRKDNNLTQTDLAQLFDCKQNFISRIESGIRPIPEDKLNLLQSKYGNISKYYTQQQNSTQPITNIKEEQIMYERLLEEKERQIRLLEERLTRCDELIDSLMGKSEGLNKQTG